MAKKIAKIKVLAGFVDGQDALYLSTNEEFTIGRDRRRSLAIMSRKVSRQHAAISYKNKHYVITDLDSKQGTAVNGRKITSPTILRSRDVIEIGKFKAEFLLEDKEKAAPELSESTEPLILPPKPTPPVIHRPKPKPPAAASRHAKIPLHKPTFSEEELSMVGKAVGGIRIIAALDKGRFTVIYKGIQDAKNRVVACKMLNAEAAQAPEVINWFLKGAGLAGRFRHEDAVSILGGGRDSQTTYIYSRFMDGGSARHRFARATEEGLAVIRRALETIVHTARALEYAHNKKILHLGVRPSKILYDEKRRAKLNGIGFRDGPPVTTGSSIEENRSYLSPEQARGSKDLTFASDIFSLGATFFYMLTGQTPPRDHRQRILSPKQINEDVPDSICRIFEKMVSPAPEKRYKSYGQLLHDVRWALRGESWPRA